MTWTSAMFWFLILGPVFLVAVAVWSLVWLTGWALDRIAGTDDVWSNSQGWR